MTKFTALLAAVFVASAGAASADHMSMIPHVQTASTSLHLGTLTADADGVVEVYDYHLAQQGELLGSHPVKAGPNTDIVVNLSRVPQYSVLVVLKQGDTPVDATVLRFNEHIAE